MVVWIFGVFFFQIYCCVFLLYFSVYAFRGWAWLPGAEALACTPVSTFILISRSLHTLVFLIHAARFLLLIPVCHSSLSPSASATRAAQPPISSAVSHMASQPRPYLSVQPLHLLPLEIHVISSSVQLPSSNYTFPSIKSFIILFLLSWCFGFRSSLKTFTELSQPL